MRRAGSRVKDHVVILARSLPGPLKAFVKRALAAGDPVVVLLFRLRHRYREPIPPVRLRARVGTPFPGDFVNSGPATIEALDEACAATGRQLGDFWAILDLGCGCGRLLTALGRRQECRTARLVGSDVDPECIAWLQGAHPELETTVNSFSPPLPFETGEFDMVFALSVFTHLDEPEQMAWLEEVRRVLSPDGVALLSVHGPATYETFRQRRMVSNSRSCSRRMSTHGSLDDEGFVFETYERSPWNDDYFHKIDGEYGISFHSREYIEHHWSPILRVRDVVAPPQMEGWQDIVIATPAAPQS